MQRQHGNLERFESAILRWQSGFPVHKTARGELPGYAVLRVLPTVPDEADDKEFRDLYVAEYVQRLMNESPGRSIGVIVRKNALEVADRGTGLLKTLPVQSGGAYDLQGLADYLALVKSKYQDKHDATILLEQEIAYDTLVKVMDTVRVYPVAGLVRVTALPCTPQPKQW